MVRRTPAPSASNAAAQSRPAASGLQSLTAIEKSVLAWTDPGPDIAFPAPLRAVISLGWLHPATARPRLTRVPPLQAIPLLVQATARRPLAEALGLGPAHMARAAAIAGAVPVWRLDRPRRFAATEEVLDMVAALIRQGAEAER